VNDFDRSRIYRFPSGQFWFTFWLDDARKHVRCPDTVSTLRGAEKWADDHLSHLRSTNQERSLILSAYAEGWYLPDHPWVKRKGISAPWAATRRAFLKKYILPRWGNSPITDLDPVTIENALLELDLSGKTRNCIRETLTIMVREARRQRVIPFNPLAEIERLPEDPRERSPLELGEIKRLFPRDLSKVWREPYGLIAYLMYCSGMRSQEVRALGPEAIRPGGVLVLRAVKVAGGLGPTKNEDERAALITDRAAGYLRRHRGGGGLLFPGRKGPLTHAPFAQAFYQALVVSKIRPCGRWITPHSLRHTWRTAMRRLELAGKIDKGSVDYMMGHRSEGVAARYIHLRPEEALEALQEYRPAINEALV
jgi:integrase